MTMDIARTRLPWDRATALAVRLAAVAAFTVYGVALLAFLDRSVDYIRFPFGNDYGEGPVLFQVAALATGDPLYQPIDQAPYVVANYPPVFHYVTWLASQVIGDPLIAGRLVSLLAALACGILIFTLVQGSLHRDHSATARRAGGALAALFFLAHYTVIGWSTTMRVDTLALALGLLGMQLFVLSARWPALTWVYGLVFALAAFTKPNMAAAALATFGTAMSTFRAAHLLGRMRALVALAICLTAGFLAFAVLAAATDSEFLRHVVTYNINEYRPDLILKRLWQSLFWRSIDLVLFLLGLAYLSIRLFDRWRKGPAARPATSDPAMLLFGGFMAASLLNVVASGKSGASVSYFLEFEAAASLALGAVAVRLATYVGSGVPNPERWRCRALVTLGLVALCWQATLGWSLKYREPNWPAIGHSQQVADLIGSAEGPVVSEEMVLLHRAGRPLFFQPFIMTRLERAGRWDPAPVVGAMERGEVSFVVLYSKLGSAPYLRRFPDGFRAALETRYKLVRRAGHLRVYAPG